MTPAQQRIFLALRQASHPWLEVWQIAKLTGLGVASVSANVRELRRKGIVVKRPCSGFGSAIEVSLTQGGVT